MTKRPALLLAATSALALSCEPGCQKSLDPLLDQYAGTFGSVVSIPADDATAPTVTLVIPDLGSGPVALTATSPPLTVSLSPSSNFFVIASAEDPDGVKEIGFRGTYGVECITGDQSINSLRGYRVRQRSTRAPAAVPSPGAGCLDWSTSACCVVDLGKRAGGRPSLCRRTAAILVG